MGTYIPNIIVLQGRNYSNKLPDGGSAKIQITSIPKRAPFLPLLLTYLFHSSHPLAPSLKKAADNARPQSPASGSILS